MSSKLIFRASKVFTQKTIPSKKDELKDILFRTERLTEQQFNNRNLEFETERITLLGGDETSIRENTFYLKNFPDDYSTLFRKEFYLGIQRLLPWIGSIDDYRKHPIVAELTNILIYSRFDKEVLDSLQELNPIDSNGFRPFKHHQFFKGQGKMKVLDFIEDAISTMDQSETYHEFRLAMNYQYGVPYLLPLVNVLTGEPVPFPHDAAPTTIEA